MKIFPHTADVNAARIVLLLDTNHYDPLALKPYSEVIARLWKENSSVLLIEEFSSRYKEKKEKISHKYAQSSIPLEKYEVDCWEDESLLATTKKIKKIFRQFEQREIPEEKLEILKESLINYLNQENINRENTKDISKWIIDSNSYRKINFILWEVFRKKPFYIDLMKKCNDVWDQYFNAESWEKTKENLIAIATKNKIDKTTIDQMQKILTVDKADLREGYSSIGENFCDKYIKETFVQRQNLLLSKIESYLKKGYSKVFVIAGSRHWQDENNSYPEFKDTLEKTRKFILENNGVVFEYVP